MRLPRSVAAAAALLPLSLAAQAASPLGPATRAGEPRLMGGLSLSVAQPVGEFHAYVKNGVGIAGHGLARLGRSGAFAVRLDGGFVNYGRETRRIPWNDDVGRVTVDLTTNNNIFHAGIGPQLMVPSGPLRPYVHGTIGFSLFSTTSAIRDRRTDEAIVGDDNHNDATWARSAGGGFLIPLTRGPRSVVFLDLGARYHDNGTVTYLREGGIQDLPGGRVAYDRIRSRADLWTYHVGVSIGGR